MHTSRRFSIAAISLIALAACQDTSPATPSAIVSDGDVTFNAQVGELVTTPLSVRVTDNSGNPVAGRVVTFAAQNGGSVSPAVDTTDFSGRASAAWRLGQRTGTQLASATVEGVTSSINFTANATSGAPASIAIQAGDNQSAVAGASVPTAPAVVLRDRFANPVPNASVVFTVAAGGGTVTGGSASTNANGVATVTEWRLGNAAAVNRLTALALANGVPNNPISFTASATAGAPASIAATNSASVTGGTVGLLVSPLPSVRVTDVNGNPVAGAAVTFTGSAGSNVVGANKLTDANGNASPDGWQLGTVSQEYTLAASVGTLAPATFRAAARAAAPSSFVIAAGNSQSVVVGRPVPVDPSVRVNDSFGNPVSGVDVLFEVVSGGGSAVGRRQVTNAQGIATIGGWTLGEEVGPNSLRVTLPGVTNGPVAAFTATATPGAPASVSAVGSLLQTLPVSSPVTALPSVIVRDIRGNPVPNVAVTFLVTAGNGTIAGASATTGANGIATLGSWTLGNTVGTQSVSARVGILPDVVFNVTAVAGAAANVVGVSSQDLGQVVVANAQAASSIPSVRVTDQFGNPVSGVSVTFALGNASSGVITGALATTNANGVATLIGWTLPTTAGIASVVATVDGLTGVTFVATMLPAAAFRVVLVSVPSSPVVQNSAQVVTVQLQDAFFNNVSQSGVTITATPGANSGTAVNGTTGTDGRASVTWTIGASTTATQSLTLSAISLTSASVSLNVIP